MKFIITQPEYFTDYDVQESAIEEHWSGTQYIRPQDTEEDAVGFLIKSAEQHRRPEPTVLLIILKKERRWSDTKIKQADGSEYTVSQMYVEAVFLVSKILLVEIENLEQLIKLTEQAGQSIIVNYSKPNGFDYPDLHVYDGYIE